MRGSCSADKGTTETVDDDSGTKEVKLLSPAVNPGEPALDDSVRCRMAGICEGLDACGRGKQRKRKRNEKTTRFGVNSMRRQVVYRAAQACIPSSWKAILRAAANCAVPCCAVPC